MILVDVIVVVAGSGFLLWSPFYRTKPAVIFLALLAGPLLAANLLPDPRAVAVTKSIVVLAYLVGVIRYPHVLAGLSEADGWFNDRLKAIMEPVREANTAWFRAVRASRERDADVQRTRTYDASTAALDELSKLVPPSENWQETTELLRAYVIVVRDRAAGNRAHQHPVMELPSDLDIERLIRQSTEAWDAALGRKARGSGG